MLTQYKLSEGQIKTLVECGAGALANYCIENNIHYVITGSSGGLDSAVMLGFAQRACQKAKQSNFNLTSIGLIMPCESSPEAEELGRLAIQKFGAKEIKIDLTQIFQIIMKGTNNIIPGVNEKIRAILEETEGEKVLTEWSQSERVAQGNIKARLRMIFGTYHVARMTKGIVLSTDNLSEFWMAFWTLHGDVGDYGIIQNIMKGLELYDIAQYFGVPKEILRAKPNDGLGVTTGGDEAQLGAPYPVLDHIMINLIQGGFNPDGDRNQLDYLPMIPGGDPKVVHKLAKRCINGAYKRKGTIVLSREELGLPALEDIQL